MERILIILGILNITAVAARTVLSYFLVRVAPFDIAQGNEQLFFERIAQGLDFLGPRFQELITGNSVFRDGWYFAAATTTPLLLSTLIFLALMFVLARYRDELTEDSLQSIFRWSIGFVCVASISVPVFAQDFWLSFAWGRMAAWGTNPYYFDLTIEFSRNLPLDYGTGRMTYGPGWALISAAIATLGGGNTFVELVLFKLVITGALIGSLIIVWKLLRAYPVYYRCLGLAIFGWLPLTVTEIAAEGHNDIVMVFFLLLWLYFLERGRVMAASLALAASVLVKYVTAPLFLLEILYFYFSLKRPLRELLVPLATAGTLMLLVLGLFYRSSDFFASATSMRSWHFFTPKDAIGFLSRLAGWPGILRNLPALLFPMIAAYAAVRYLKSRTDEGFRFFVLAVMSAILFTAPGHIFPWYILWVLPVSALIPFERLSYWNIGAAIAFPFALVPLQLTFLSDRLRWEWPGLLVFGFAMFWLFLNWWLSSGTKLNVDGSWSYPVAAVNR